jgi:hypothetical protein
MVRPALLALAIAGLAAAAVVLVRPAEPQGPDYSLHTPPVRVGAQPLGSTPLPARSAHRITPAEARALKPLLAAWGRAVRRGQNGRASSFFAVPATIAMLSDSVRYRTAAEVRAFNRALPCGVRLLSVERSGRYVVGIFRLTSRPKRVCDAPGQRIRIAFLVRDGKFMEWRRVANAPGTPVDPAATATATPASEEARPVA